MYKRPIEKKKIVTVKIKSLRNVCSNCEFIEQRCLCPYIKKINNQTILTILQHPSEVKHPLNTVKLLAKSFLKINIYVGEDFSNSIELQELLNNYKDHQALIFPNPQALLLKPESESDDHKINHLILLDGSWKKAKKIYYSNAFLQRLPSYYLESNNISEYIIRKSPMEKSLSTLEATILALKSTDPDCETNSLKIAFNKMIDYQIERMGHVTFEKNYLKNKKKEQ